MSYLLPFCQCLIALVFLVAATGKLRSRNNYRAYVESLRAMQLLPAAIVNPLAGLVAAAELAVPLLLLPLSVPVLNVAGFILAGLMLTSFATAIVVILRRGMRAECHCFGATTATFGWHHIVRNAGLVAVAAAGALTLAADITTNGPELVLAVSLAIISFAIIARLDDLVALFLPVGNTRR